MNKKGITLVEVIISIGLVSVVMIFLFNLLVDMQYEEAHASFSKVNQLSRAAIIQTIQNDFKDLKLVGAVKTVADGSVNITFNFETTSKILTITPNKINYHNEEAWIMEDENASYDIENITVTMLPEFPNAEYPTVNRDATCTEITNPNSEMKEKVCSKYQSIKIVIPVVTSEKANVMDDIELFYIRKTS